MSAPLGQRLLRPFRRLADALADPARGNRAAFLVIAAYVLAWWIYAVVAKGSQDIHFDMGEMVSWSLVPAYGYPKHPPFPAWVVAVWFAVFPHADWAFYLLATVCVGVALWFVWLIAARQLDGHKRVIALTMLMFSPGFNFHPLKFNSNSLLIPVWAAASYLFLRSFSERTVLWGALAGVGAAVAMLTKYWSIFLVLGFVAAVLCDPRRGDYLRSPAPWTAVIVGALLLAPNIATLFEYDFGPFKYATVAHAVTFDGVIRSLDGYLAGALYLAGGLIAAMIACRPDPAAIRDALLPHERDRRLMAVATWTAFLAPILLALALRTRLDALWTMPMWAMVPTILLASTRLAVSRHAAAGVLAAAFAVPLVVLLLSPAIAYVIHRQGPPNHASHYRMIAGAVDKAWRQATDRPLRFLGGHGNIALSAAFYLPSRPLFVDIGQPHLSPWADDARLARDGMAVVCPAADLLCLSMIEPRVAASKEARRTEAELSRSYLGAAGPPVRYLIVIIPPRPSS